MEPKQPETLIESNHISAYDDADGGMLCEKDVGWRSGTPSPNSRSLNVIVSSPSVEKHCVPDNETDVIGEERSPSANYRATETTGVSVENQPQSNCSKTLNVCSEPEVDHPRNGDLPSERDVDDSESVQVSKVHLPESNPRLEVDQVSITDPLTSSSIPSRSPTFQTSKKERQMSPDELRRCNDAIEPSVVRRLESFVSMMGTRRHRHHHGVVQHNYKLVESSGTSRNGQQELDAGSGSARRCDRSRSDAIEDHEKRTCDRKHFQTETSAVNGMCRQTNILSQAKGVSGRSCSTEAPLDLSLRGTTTEPALPVGSASLKSPYLLVNDYVIKHGGSIPGVKRRGVENGTTVGDDRGGATDSLLKLEKTFGEHSRILDRVGYAGTLGGSKRRDIANVIPLSQNGGLSVFGTSSLFSAGTVTTTSPSSSSITGLMPPGGIYNTALRDLTASVSGLNSQHIRAGSRSIPRRHHANAAISSSSVSLPSSQHNDQPIVESVFERRRLLTTNPLNGDEVRNSELPSDTTQKSSGEVNAAPVDGGSKSSSAAGVRRLVRGQDAWMNGTGQLERRSSVLRCLECGLSFWSLPDLTLHMIRTAHYANIIRAPVTCSSGMSSSASPPTSAFVTANSTAAAGTSSPSTSSDAVEFGKDNSKKRESDVDSERDADADASSAESEIEDGNWGSQSDTTNITASIRLGNLDTSFSQDRRLRHRMHRRHRKRKHRHSLSSGMSTPNGNETGSKRRCLEDRQHSDTRVQSTRMGSGPENGGGSTTILTMPDDGDISSQRQRLAYSHTRRRGETKVPEGSMSSSSMTPSSSPTPNSYYDVENLQKPVPVKVGEDEQNRSTAPSVGATASALSAMENFIGRSLIEMDRTVVVSSGIGTKPTTSISARISGNARDRTPQPASIPRSMEHHPSHQASFAVAPTSDVLPSLFGCSSSDVNPSAALAQLCWSPFVLEYLVATSRLLGGGLPVVPPLVPSGADACRDLFGIQGNGSLSATTILPMFAAAAAAAAAASAVPVVPEPGDRRHLVDEFKSSSFDGKEHEGRKESMMSATLQHRIPQSFLSPLSNGSASVQQFRTKTPGIDEERSLSSTSPGSDKAIPAAANHSIGNAGGGSSSRALDSLRGFVYGSSSSTTADFVQPMLHRRALEEQRASLSTSSSSSSLSSTPKPPFELNRQQHQHQQLDAKKRLFESAHTTPAIDNAPPKSGQQRHGIVSPPKARDSKEGAIDQALLSRFSATTPIHKNGHRTQLTQKDSGELTRSRTADRGTSNTVAGEPEPEGDGEYDSRFDKYYRLARELTRQVH